MSLVLLTGGLGYIGGRLAMALVGSGYHVRCGTSRPNQVAPTWCANMNLVHIDWQSQESIENACRDVDCVVHLAAMNENDSCLDPVGALRVNGMFSVKLLEAAKDKRVRRFIYFSTAHVYGSPLQGVISETSITRPSHPYSITHRVTEDFVLAAHDKRHIEGVVLRLSNSFGVPATHEVNRWSLLVNDLCRQTVTAGQIRLNSSGVQLRDFITLGDVCGAVEHLLRLDISNLKDGLFNLGGDNTQSVLNMANRIAERWRIMTDYQIEIKSQSDNGIHPVMLTYCSEKLKSVGFRVKSEIDLEIDNTLGLCLRTLNSQTE